MLMISFKVKERNAKEYVFISDDLQIKYVCDLNPTKKHDFLKLNILSKHNTFTKKNIFVSFKKKKSLTVF